jgi:tRNA (cmo5U34)-methyltransferase
MRQAAAEGLSDYGNRASLVDLDMFSEIWPDEFSNSDAIVSGFAIHHGRDSAQYKSLYGRIQASLHADGLFINLDHVAGENRAETISNAEAWRDFLDEDGGIESDKFIVGSYAEDTPIEMSEHLRLLDELGFDQVECYWQRMIFGLYGARKSG